MLAGILIKILKQTPLPHCGCAITLSTTFTATWGQICKFRKYLLYPTHKGIGLSKFDNHNLVSPPHTTALGLVHKTLSDGAGTGTSAHSSPLRQATAHQDASFTSG